MPQQDHIFPQSALRKVRIPNPATGKRDSLKYDSRERDQLANLMLLTAEENGFTGKCDTLPETWFAEQGKKDPAYLERHMISQDRALWQLDNYEQFIDARKRLILERLRPYLQTVVA